MKKFLSLALVVATAGAFVVIAQDGDPGRAFNSSAPRYTADGEILRPEGWRKWVYVGTPLTPHDMNNGKAAFPEFHNVYVDPESFSTFERTGEFPNGTQLVKELTMVGSKEAVSGNGYFMGDFSGLEIAVKDTERFKAQPGGWAYFSFGHTPESEYAATAKMFPAESCNSCHAASADTDYVFTQYYPVLKAAMPKHKRMEAEAGRAAAKKMDSKTMSAAMGAVGASSATASADEYSMKLFKWLQDGGYKNYAAEGRVHPSSSGAAVHGDVRVFFNDKLHLSMRQGAKTHPVGSVAVKELHKDGSLYGWAMSLKARDDDGIPSSSRAFRLHWLPFTWQRFHSLTWLLIESRLDWCSLRRAPVLLAGELE